MRKTKIVCTIGPACNNKETLLAMINAGMNVARINMSHGAYDDLENTFNVLKEAIAESGKIVSILLDTKGPEVRVCTFENGSIELIEGQLLAFARIKKSVTKQAWQFLSLSLLICSMPTAKRQ